MGQKVEVGRLVFNVLEAEWKSEIQGGKQTPKNRFLQLRVTVTNSGNQVMPLPFLRLIDSAGKETPEFSEIEMNSQWMGMIRRLQPAITEDGMIYFDVPVGAYKLEVVDNSDAENEKAAFIDIPAALAPPAQVPAPGSGI